MTASRAESEACQRRTPLQRMTHGLLQVVTDTLALLVAALSAFKDRQIPIMAILLMLLIEVHAPALSLRYMCVPDRAYIKGCVAPSQHENLPRKAL